MAEQTLCELVDNLILWIESLHVKNLKYQAQVETLSRDLATAQTSNKQLEAKLSAYENSDNSKNPVNVVPVNNPMPAATHMNPQPVIYQPIASHPQAFVHQPAPYLWTTTYETGEMQVPYYQEYGNPTFLQP